MKNTEFTLNNNHIVIEPALIVFGEIAGFVGNWDFSGVQIKIKKDFTFDINCLRIDIVVAPTEDININQCFISMMNETIQNNFEVEGMDNIVSVWHGDNEATFFIKNFFGGQHKPMDEMFVLRVLEEVRSQQLTEPQITLA